MTLDEAHAHLLICDAKDKILEAMILLEKRQSSKTLDYFTGIILLHNASTELSQCLEAYDELLNPELPLDVKYDLSDIPAIAFK